MNIKIADYNIRISGADFGEFNERFKDYITDSAPEDADLDIDFSIDDNITVPTEKLTVPYFSLFCLLCSCHLIISQADIRNPLRYLLLS